MNNTLMNSGPEPEDTPDLPRLVPPPDLPTMPMGGQIGRLDDMADLHSEIALLRSYNPELAYVLQHVRPGWLDKRRLRAALHGPMADQVKTIAEGQLAVTRLAVTAREVIAKEAFQELASRAQAMGRRQSAEFILLQEALFRRSVERAVGDFVNHQRRGMALLQSCQDMPALKDQLMDRWGQSVAQFMKLLARLESDFLRVAEEKLSI